MKDWGLVLGPGASANRQQPALIAIDDAVVSLGVKVERIDLPRGKAERAIPAMVRAAAKLDVEHVLLGGRSFGGRVASMAVAAGEVPNAAGLVLVSYPLGKGAKARAHHLPDITVPCLFVSGTRDNFCTPDELSAAAATIPAEVTHVWIEGGNHGLRGKDAEVAAAVRAWVVALS